MASRRRCCCKGTTICVKICTTVAVVGATVAIYTGSTLVASCVTGSNGCCTIDATGTYTLTVTVSGTVVYSASRTLNGTQINISLPAGSTTVCCGGYAIPTSLTLTDAIGSLSFVYDSSSSPPTWYGGHAVTETSCTITQGGGGTCVTNVATSGPVRVCYIMTCNAGSSPVFSLSRTWSYVLAPTTLTPTWYQDPSGFTPGVPCATGSPGGCGGGDDLSSDSENPTTTSPFAISFNPVAAGSNQTTDPIGGSVAIS